MHSLLITETRGPWVENRHSGWVVVSNAAGVLEYCTPGGQEVATFFRSAAKPFQAIPLLEKGLLPELAAEELAIACASHVASAEHLRWVRSLLRKSEMGEQALLCGPHLPLDAVMQTTLQETGQAPQPIHNNCSGKHAGMLLACHYHQWNPKTYLQMDHPLQQRILEELTCWGGGVAIERAVDGCGAPTFYLPLQTMARLFARLATGPLTQPLVLAMTRHPILVGGEGRVDTALMQATAGGLLAKVGADGVICVAHLKKGRGLALKIADGNTAIRNLAIVPILAHLGWLKEEALRHPALTPFTQRERVNTCGQVVGQVEVHV